MKVYLLGGLGNQLFQLAFAENLQKDYECEIMLDRSTLFGRDFAISSLILNPKIVVLESGKKTRLFHKLASRGLIPGTHIEQASIRVLEKDLEFRPNSKFYGYFQNRQFVDNVQCEIFSSFIHLVGEHLISQDVYISLHIRGGDYIGNSIYHPLGLAYYSNALNAALSLTKCRTVKIFTDDYGHATKLIHEIQTLTKNRFHFTFGCRGNTPLEDLAEMSKGVGVIVANSTYSWWAGWYIHRSGGWVIRPSKYLRANDEVFIKDFYPLEWNAIVA